LYTISEKPMGRHNMVDLKDYAPFTGLLIFGNIENLILASQGAVAHVDPIILSVLSLIAVVIWLLLGTYGTRVAIKYADYIEIFGGVAIIVLGFQSMLEANDCPVLDEALEEMSLMWADDLPYILAMIQRTISNMRISHTQLRVAEKYKSEEDPQFLKTLFEKALVNYNDYQRYVERFTANWDIERVVFMDNLILGVAIAELVAFPSIPVKVTMDEWIEISKYYSTPGSSTFINGVLDKIVALLTEEGKIQKSGRGLI
ncbi:MAG: transcription antitermination protein NusB, partial [Alistipes sp.]|nr:transcription antitermination protein NusB [Alistipes sp.]